jgi:hypothetical protein
MAVAKKSGEYIEFDKSMPGKIIGDQIIARHLLSAIAIDSADIKEKKIDAQGKIYEITTKDGKRYRVVDFREAAGKFYGRVLEASETIPLSQVEMIWVRKTDPGMSFLVTIGAAAGVFLGLMLFVLLTKESCPFIYSYNGEQYVFDAEPYGGAICEGLKRTEWCGLESLKETNGLYKLKMTNEVDETQYTDELKLVIVDHPANIRVVSDESGNFCTLTDPLPPFRAYDAKGRSIIPQVLKKDWIYWKTPEDEISPDREALKDELVFEFPKPAGAKKVKFLFNGCNTLWGSQMLKKLLELNGNKIQDFYNEINALGPAYDRMRQWIARDELFRLQVRVEAAGHWKSKGMLLGGGPFISEDRIYHLNIEDVPGDVLKVKLTPPAVFWMINQVAVDYTKDLPLKATEIQAAEASDSQGRDVRDALSLTDGQYFSMPKTSDWADLVFIVPPRQESLSRSVFAKASGYYDIHLKSGGEPQVEILEKIRTQPGFVIQHAMKEYQKWKAETETRAGR